jgi:hypothetical protein
MKNESIQPLVAAGASDPNGASPELREEVERLREALRAVEQERDGYRVMLYGLLKKQFTEKDIIVPGESDSQTFDQFVHELEHAIDRDTPRAAK